MNSKYYRHFKGNYYKVLFVAYSSETLEELVVYRALYGEEKIWVRPKSMFYETVSKPGYDGPRFMPVGILDVLKHVKIKYLFWKGDRK